MLFCSPLGDILVTAMPRICELLGLELLVATQDSVLFDNGVSICYFVTDQETNSTSELLWCSTLT